MNYSPFNRAIGLCLSAIRLSTGRARFLFQRALGNLMRARRARLPEIARMYATYAAQDIAEGISRRA